MYVFTYALSAAFFLVVMAVVTEKDLQAQLGIDPKALTEVSWKDFVNSKAGGSVGAPAPAPAPGGGLALPMNLELNQGVGAHCLNDTHCDTNKSIFCIASVCNCKEDHFPNDNGTECEFRKKVELGKPCTKKDNCYVAFAICANGTCICRPGFLKVNDVCRPTEYDCPFKTPFMVKGIPWPCIPDLVKSSCPNGYSCLQPADGTRPRLLSPSGIEQTYCCPNVPNLNLTIDPFDPSGPAAKIFDRVCLFGKPNKEVECPTEKGYYYFPGIGLGSVCCPDPCLKKDLMTVQVKNGKCTYE